MKPPPRLRLEPRPSRIACALIPSACVAMATLIFMLPLPIWIAVASLAAVAGVAAHGFWRCTGRGLPALLHVGADRRITASGRDGRSCDGTILDESYVGAHLTIIVWRPDRSPLWEPSRSILILPDMLPSDDFRRLRIWLRYGRAAVDGATSGADAG
jgi:membrane-bound toxin of toxin-antitoxin system